MNQNHDTSSLNAPWQAALKAARAASRAMPASSARSAAVREGDASPVKAIQRASTMMRHAGARMRSWAGGHRSQESASKPPTNPLDVLAQARKRASKVAMVTAGVATWKESAELYQRYQSGELITWGTLWQSAQRVGHRSMAASRGTNRRIITVAALNAAARLVARQTAGRIGDNIGWKVIHVTSKRLAGRAGHVLLAVDVFKTMKSDVDRFRDGKLSHENFYRNCVLTGVGIAAPMVGAAAGPGGATVGMVVAVSAGMMRK